MTDPTNTTEAEEQPQLSVSAAQRRFSVKTYMVLTYLHTATTSGFGSLGLDFVTPQQILAEAGPQADLNAKDVYNALASLEEAGYVSKIARGHYRISEGVK